MINPRLGIIGGGQLGSMLCQAAKKINIESTIFSDDQNSPAKNFCDKFIYGKYDDDSKIFEFTNSIDLVTLEFENIPYETLLKINKLKNVNPNPEIIRITQNRLLEKDFINSLGLKTTDYIFLKEDHKINSKFFPGILKTCTLGYDGKGQSIINSIEEFSKLKIDLGKEFILEKLVKLKKEISVILTRFNDGSIEIYEPFENVHKNQILDTTKIPAEINDEIKIKSKEWSIKISENLKYIGSLCIEFFVDDNNKLYVNEMAPRVHNSGHLTINSHNISQFENHIRAVCDLDRINLNKIHNATMKNIIGEEIKLYKNRVYKKNEFFYDYLKSEIKENRKMGHLTIIKK
tara:strand:+ start:475 stop:1515 length:1041 start_codon:yes stop_codon:yes gene_type:complete